MKETKKEINWKENTLASKGKGKGNDWKNQKKIMTSGKQLDTIVYPPNKPHYSVSGLLMDYPLEKLFESCFLIGF